MEPRIVLAYSEVGSCQSLGLLVEPAADPTMHFPCHLSACCSPSFDWNDLPSCPVGIDIQCPAASLLVGMEAVVISQCCWRKGVHVVLHRELSMGSGRAYELEEVVQAVREQRGRW